MTVFVTTAVRCLIFSPEGQRVARKARNRYQNSTDVSAKSVRGGVSVTDTGSYPPRQAESMTAEKPVNWSTERGPACTEAGPLVGCQARYVKRQASWGPREQAMTTSLGDHEGSYITFGLRVTYGNQCRRWEEDVRDMMVVLDGHRQDGACG
ncbi:hypothetical protein LX32DRAFT_298109 [Colletotrichum zoysiae]|uniref:Uncharacterized protein n=1 Tax=Colletotrichum zoysiae TaxID=1216348 RepID=A0AAD9H1K5_9PEZI|nr:hypothetical protein LX32DRAFT_298109 [Colletotrichum zoysiae]